MVSFTKILLISQTVLSASLFGILGNEQSLTLPSRDERPIPGGSPISVCDITEPQLLSIDSVIISPNPPQRGQNLTVSAIGHLTKDVEDGAYVDVDVRYGYIKLISQTYDLCEQVGEVDLECPLSKGEYKLSKIVEIPAEVPPGKYTVFARAYTKDDEFISCITGSIVFNADRSWKILG
ncbi:hypothetical protein WICMUC_005107 [Wickerhamomyces mucosus]|uniref:Phosphatidylglycerol/phosphatidylinositol transfer protein n=1 Tax=Wickerhamomyces mucosus TaxID=1378264 RepID=A0A9P8PBN4_9ASCO|nr:hypothetical protein WICMUC_005107 [Wickerhamomyces mucosus]